jgi:hypothetical protein
MQAVADEAELQQLMRIAFEVGTNMQRGTDDERSASVANLADFMSKPKDVRRASRLSRVVNGINSVPEILTKSDKKEKHTKAPSNVVTGLGYGGYALVKGVYQGVTGIFIEPVRGGMHGGAKGVAKGFGRGLIGIVAKPIGGVAGLV